MLHTELHHRLLFERVDGSWGVRPRELANICRGASDHFFYTVERELELARLYHFCLVSEELRLDRVDLASDLTHVVHFGSRGSQARHLCEICDDCADGFDLCNHDEKGGGLISDDGLAPEFWAFMQVASECVKTALLCESGVEMALPEISGPA